MKIPSIFKTSEVKKNPWQWSSCNYPETLSFRATEGEAIFKTVNSVFLEASEDGESCTNLSTDDKNDKGVGVESLEMIISEVRSSERLFFEPGEKSSILKEEKEEKERCVDFDFPYKGSVALALESNDPYLDFKKSMQEMVDSHELREWDKLEELLIWYLKMNGEMNHGFIVSAFVNLVVESGTDSSSSEATAICSSNLTDSSFSAPHSPLFSRT